MTPVPGVVVSPERWFQPIPPIAYVPNFSPKGKGILGLKVHEYWRALAPGVRSRFLVAWLIGRSFHMNSLSTPKNLGNLYPTPTTAFAPVFTNEPRLLSGKPGPRQY